jgi:hypothetical protein
MNIFDTGHILTAHFNLSYLDVANINLNERIYVHDSWWNINKIVDYDVNSRRLTKVELISSDKTINDFVPISTSVKVSANYFSEMNEAINQSNKLDGSRNTYGNNVTNVTNLGSSNVNQSKTHNSLVVGDNNKLDGGNIFINGNKNNVTGNNVTVLGLDGGTYTESGRTYTNTLIRVSNFVNAGRDEILNHFPDNKIVNIIDGGRDEVRPLGTHSIETNVDGGRDTVI